MKLVTGMWVFRKSWDRIGRSGFDVLPDFLTTKKNCPRFCLDLEGLSFGHFQENSRRKILKFSDIFNLSCQYFPKKGSRILTKLKTINRQAWIRCLLEFIRLNQEDVFLIDTLVFHAVWYDNFQSTVLEIYLITDSYRFLSFEYLRAYKSVFKVS